MTNQERKELLQLINAYEVDLENELADTESTSKALVIVSKLQASREIKVAIMTYTSN